MIRSMTGFGRGEAHEEGQEAIVEIKTVNHRYSDIFIRMPRQISFLEEKVRGFIGERISRGKIDVYISYDDLGEASGCVMLDEGLTGAYIKALCLLRDKYGLKDDISISLLARFPDILNPKKVGTDEESIWRLIKKALEEAMESLLAMREREGGKIKRDLTDKIASASGLLDGIAARAPFVPKDYKQKLELRIKELLEQQTIDENRIAAEVAVFADRCSIDEEITRLRSHINQLAETLNMEEPVGRKLDFLIQEMNREANTIGSKANDIEIIKCVIELKSEIEKMREQAQNIE